MVRIYCASPQDLALTQSQPCTIHPFAMPDTSLDALDSAILDIPQQDNTPPQRAIAEAVHLPPAAVQRRVHRLNTRGVVRADVALGWLKAGMQLPLPRSTSPAGAPA